MEKTKVYKVLTAFTTLEFNRLEKFISSPYFNKNEQLKSYFSLLRIHFKKNRNAEITKQYIWDQLYPGKPIDEARFRKLTADLLQLIMQFLGVEKYQSSHLTQANFILSTIQEREITPLYNSTIKLAKRLSERHFYRNSAYYYQQYLLEKNIFKLKDFDQKRAVKSNIEQLNLMQIMQDLDFFYLAEKLRYYSAILTWEKLYQQGEKILFMDEIIHYVRENDFIQIPSIAIYYYIILVILYPEQEDNYYVLKELVQKHFELFDTEEQKELYGALINYSIRRLNIGRKTFLREAFENYKIGLKNDFLYVNNRLSHFLFKNIVTSGLRLNEFDWIEDFIEEFNDRLDPEIRDSTVAYNLANLHFYRNNYSKVLELLQEVEIPELYYNLGAKTILMATYYELEEWDALDAFLHSFRVYLNRNKHLEFDRKRRYLDLITLVKKLSLVSHRDTESIQKLYQEVKDSQVPSKNWLLKNVSALLPKK